MSMKGLTGEWLQGVDVVDAVAAGGGLALTSMLPGMLVKSDNKVLKLGAALGAAVAAGFIARNISSSAGKAAVVGGVAGVVVQALGMFTSVKIGDTRQLSSGIRRLGVPVNQPAQSNEAGIIVSST